MKVPISPSCESLNIVRVEIIHIRKLSDVTRSIALFHKMYLEPQR